MSEHRPFIPGSARAVAPSAAPAFPAMGERREAAPAPNRAFMPRRIDAEKPKVDLQAMLDKAQRDVDALEARARSQSNSLQEEKTKLDGSIAALEEARGRACRVLARDAVMLGVEIAHSLAGRAFEVDHTHLLSLVEACLQEFSAEHAVTIRVAPGDVASVQAQIDSGALTAVEVRADPTMTAGDLAVEAEQMVIDARLSERLSTLREELAATVRADQPLEDAPEAEATTEPDPT